MNISERRSQVSPEEMGGKQEVDPGHTETGCRQGLVVHGEMTADKSSQGRGGGALIRRHSPFLQVEG